MCTKLSLIAMNSGELGRLLHHAENNHSIGHYTGGRIVHRCSPFLTQDYIVIAIEFDTGSIVHRFVADPEADESSISMYNHLMSWLDQPNDDMMDA